MSYSAKILQQFHPEVKFQPKNVRLDRTISIINGMTRIFSWRCYLTRFIWRVKKLCLLFCRRSAASKIPRENWWERLSKNSIWTAAEKEFDSKFETVKSLVSLLSNFFDAISMHFLIATIFTTFYQFLRLFRLRFRSFLRILRYFLTIFEFLPN